MFFGRFGKLVLDATERLKGVRQDLWRESCNTLNVRHNIPFHNHERLIFRWYIIAALKITWISWHILIDMQIYWPNLLLKRRSWSYSLVQSPHTVGIRSSSNSVANVANQWKDGWNSGVLNSGRKASNSLSQSKYHCQCGEYAGFEYLILTRYNNIMYQYRTDIEWLIDKFTYCRLRKADDSWIDSLSTCLTLGRAQNKRKKYNHNEGLKTASAVKYKSKFKKWKLYRSKLMLHIKRIQSMVLSNSSRL